MRSAPLCRASEAKWHFGAGLSELELRIISGVSRPRICTPRPERPGPCFCEMSSASRFVPLRGEAGCRSLHKMPSHSTRYYAEQKRVCAQTEGDFAAMALHN